MLHRFNCGCSGPNSSVKAVEPSASIKLAKDLVELVSARQSSATMETLFAEDSTVKFPETELTSKCFFEYSDMLVKSFPDFRLEANGFQEIEPNVVQFTSVACGSHTGEPFSFGPFPPINATGKVCRNDPETSKITVVDGKIKRWVVTPTGEHSGFAGFYTQLGGLVI